MGDVAPGLEKAVDRDAFFEMLAVVPAVEIGFIRGVDVHRRQQHAFSGERHFLRAVLLCLVMLFDARSAIAFITASRDAGIVQRMAGALDDANLGVAATARRAHARSPADTADRSGPAR